MRVLCHAEPLEHAWEHSQFMLIWDGVLEPPTFRFYLLDEDLRHQGIWTYRSQAAAGFSSQAGSSSATSLARASSASGSTNVQMQQPTAGQSLAGSQQGRRSRAQAVGHQHQAASATRGSATDSPPGLRFVGMPPGLPQPAQTGAPRQDLLPDMTFGDLHNQPIAFVFQGHTHPSRHLVALASQAALVKCRQVRNPEEAVDLVLHNDVSGEEKVRQPTLLLLPS